MKVLLVNLFLYRKGGSETVFFNTADLLRAAGHEVVLFGLEDPANEDYPAPVYTCRGWHGLAGKVRKAKDYFCNREAARLMDEVLTKERPDIVHMHLFWGGITASVIEVIHRHGIPVVYTAHDYRMVCPAYTFRDGKGEVCERCRGGRFTECFRNRCSKGNPIHSLLMAEEMKYRNKRWHPARELDGIIYVSRFAKQKHEDTDPLFREVRSTVLYNCTALAARYPDLPEDGGYYLYYGRLSHEKGIQTLTDAVSNLPGVKLKVVGTGPLEESLKANCKRSDIEFLGYKSGDELYGLVRAARFVCVPSEWYENNPMTIVEAYSLGVPVIGARIGGIPEIVEEGRTGFLFRSVSIESLSAVIREAGEVSGAARSAMAQNARAFSRQHFNPDDYAGRLLSFYRDVINHYQANH